MTYFQNEYINKSTDNLFEMVNSESVFAMYNNTAYLINKGEYNVRLRHSMFTHSIQPQLLLVTNIGSILGI